MKHGVQAAVLAGGLSTRMRPRTLTVPKSMLEVAGRPFVDWQIEQLAASGLGEVVMCIGHLGQQIRAHVGDGARYGIRVLWSEDGADDGAKASAPDSAQNTTENITENTTENTRGLLGTAGALRAALPLLAPTFLVTYGDSYLPFDYTAPLRILNAHDDCDGVMAVYKNDGKWDQSNVETDGVWVIRYEKGVAGGAFDHIDYGATALRREIIAALPPGEPHGLDALGRDLARRKRLRACVAQERFFEIGSPAGLTELDRHLRTRAPRP
jgi:MurNAc alpha-1-phosphate uridylyltransferase